MTNPDFSRTLAVARHDAGQRFDWFVSCLHQFVDTEVNEQIIEDPSSFDADLAIVMAASSLLDMLAGGSVTLEAVDVISSTESGE